MTIFTAIGDGLTDDTAALNDFIAASDYAVIPPGCYRTTGPLIPRNGQRIEFSGDASIIKPDGNVTDKVIDFTGVCHTSIANLRIQPPANADLKCINLDSCENVTIERVRFDGGGGFPIYVKNSLDCDINNIYVSGGYLKTGIQVNDSRNIFISRHKIYAANQGLYGIQAIRGKNVTIQEGYVERTPNNYFGIHSWGCSYGKVKDNRVENTRREAIAIGSGCQGVEITGNHCIWSENIGTGDFGISMAGDSGSQVVADFLIKGNTIVNSAFDGIGIAGFVQRGTVSENTIRDSCRANSLGFNAGVKLYGWVSGAFTQGVMVSNNTISKISSPGLVYSVFEKPEKGSVDRNTVSRNNTYGLAASHVFLSGANSLNLS